jgi:MSHA biogenesis protein MshP
LSAVQISTFNYALQGARAYQSARAGIEWAIARIDIGGSCTEVNAQTAMTFTGLEGFSVGLSCSSRVYTEGDRTLTYYRIDSLSHYGAYTDSDYVAREIEVSIVK